MDLGDCDRLFRSRLSKESPAYARQQAALELLGVSSCPRDDVEGILMQRIRRDCYRELDQARSSYRV